MRSALLIIIFVGIHFSFMDVNPEQKAYNHIRNIKKGVVLVRLHTDDAVVEQMRKLSQQKTLKRKLAEIEKKNSEIYKALNTAYTFGEIRFFYARNSKDVREGNFEGIFLGADLTIDSSITIPQNVPIYILDVGDIYFDAISGHMEGVVVMNNEFKPLEKPFPFYVRKRSGMAIIKRTDLDIAMLLNKNFEEFYSRATSQPSH